MYCLVGLRAVALQAEAAAVRASYGEERRRQMAAAATAKAAQQTAREKAKRKKDSRYAVTNPSDGQMADKLPKRSFKNRYIHQWVFTCVVPLICFRRALSRRLHARQGKASKPFMGPLRPPPPLARSKPSTADAPAAASAASAQGTAAAAAEGRIAEAEGRSGAQRRARDEAAAQGLRAWLETLRLEHWTSSFEVRAPENHTPSLQRKQDPTPDGAFCKFLF